MGVASLSYKIVFLLHLLCVVVGFGSTFVWPVLARRAQDLDPAGRYAVNHLAFQSGKFLTSPFIYAAIAFGIGLVVVSDGTWKFSQTWVSIAFALVIVSLGISLGLHLPNLKKMDALGARLAAGEVTASPGGPPAEVQELQARAPKAAMYGGILHLLFLLLMIDMIWKPGLG